MKNIMTHALLFNKNLFEFFKQYKKSLSWIMICISKSYALILFSMYILEICEIYIDIRIFAEIYTKTH